MRFTSGAGVVVLLAAVTAACTSTGSPEPPPRVAWSAVRLPAGFAPSLLAPGPAGQGDPGETGDTVLVAEDGSSRHPPRLLELDGDATAAVPVVAASFYGRRTVWGGIATAGRRVYAFGGRSGGAHGNVRWTAWSGTLGPSGRLAEDVQDFETFGGPAAGGLAQIVAPAAGPPLLVGSRVSDTGAGLDIAVWAFDDGRWVRRPSAGTPLAADDEQQPSASAITRRGDGLLIAGSITSFGDGVHTRPAIWSSPGSGGPWTRTVLPAPDDEVAEAEAAACDPDGRCLVAGYAGERLAAWTVSAAGAVAAIDLPDVPAGPAAVEIGAYARAGLAAVTVADPDGGSQVLVDSGSGWRELEVPSGTVTGFAVTERALWLVTAAPAGARLWTALR
ncbi:hypothetical protein [Nocardioides sp. T2.26MG-1]|uniref:hypothetical protein n=1 Tax=Nocardioides sp. T2.26MG-1 TaxID=3041166 RepID=UPI002477A3AA|nr:hypothetical protein [Nocardioides sp. T2.26MG-1]CAI9412655.1 hypothetical protein HIDPHFAB_01826 [Nocardioides sp. T2.26MG-1]